MLIKGDQTIELIDKYKKRYPAIADSRISRFNIETFSYCLLYLEPDQEEILATSLIYDPFQISDKTKITDQGDEIARVVAILEKIARGLIRHHGIAGKLEKIVILYFAFWQAYFKCRLTRDIPEIRKQAESALSLLNCISATKIREDLEDDLFAFSNPEAHKRYRRTFSANRKMFGSEIEKIKTRLLTIIYSAGLNCEFEYRFKTYYSIHKKIMKEGLLPEQVTDTIGARLIFKKIPDCYQAMALILSEWPAVAPSVKDYIEIPKPNGYRSIHLNIIENGLPIEIQLRTEKMHNQANFGRAAHFKYKNEN